MEKTGYGFISFIWLLLQITYFYCLFSLSLLESVLFPAFFKFGFSEHFFSLEIFTHS